MKKSMILFLVLLHCFLLGACGQTAGQIGSQGIGADREPVTANGFESDAEPEIVIYEGEVQWEELRDMDNGLCGYAKRTKGTDNKINDVVLLEIYDQNQNLLHSFPSKLPGGSMALGIAGNIIHISDSNDYGFNRYSLKISDLSHFLAYEEYRDGATVRLDLYGSDGQVVKTLTPSDPANQLNRWDHHNGVFVVSEYSFINDNWSYGVPIRHMYYTEECELLLETQHTIELFDEWTHAVTHIEARDQEGNVLYVHDRTAEHTTLEESYNPDYGVFVVREKFVIDSIFYDDDDILYLEEYRDPQTKEIIFSARQVYQGDQFQYTEMSAYGGKVEVVAGPTVGTYSRLEFYDPDGVLQATFGAVEKGGWLTVRRISNERLYIDIYNGSGRVIHSRPYPPNNPE